MANEEWKETHAKVLAAINDAGVPLFTGPFFCDRGEAAYYSRRNPTGPGSIRLHREHGSIVEDYRFESVLLAHELGHANSAHKGTAPARELQIKHSGTDLDLSPEEAQTIYAEENRAWAYGLALLEKMGCPDMSYAAGQRAESLAVYRDRLKARCPSWQPPGSAPAQDRDTKPDNPGK